MTMYMAKVSVDTSELKRWAKKLENLAEKELDSFLMESARMLAAEFIQRVQERTPVGDYPDKIEFTTKDGKAVSFDNPVAGKQGGHLKNSWKMGSMKKTGDGYEIEIFNDASNGGEVYASDVEYGHRIMNKKGGPVKGFQKGVFMMKHTEIEMAFVAPELLEKKLEEFLRRGIGDG